MKVLFLGNIGSPVIEILRSAGDEVAVSSQVLTREMLNGIQPGFIVSFGYPHRVKQEVIDRMQGRIVNLHLSYLPWNRGSDPDFWSLADDTPKGVTIHYMNAALDAGEVIVQEIVEPGLHLTFSAYGELLRSHVLQLFKFHWESIKTGTCRRTPQTGAHTYHRSVDKSSFLHLLPQGSETVISTILKRYL